MGHKPVLVYLWFRSARIKAKRSFQSQAVKGVSPSMGKLLSTRPGKTPQVFRHRTMWTADLECRGRSQPCGWHGKLHHCLPPVHFTVCLRVADRNAFWGNGDVCLCYPENVTRLNTYLGSAGIVGVQLVAARPWGLPQWWFLLAANPWLQREWWGTWAVCSGSAILWGVLWEQLERRQFELPLPSAPSLFPPSYERLLKGEWHGATEQVLKRDLRSKSEPLSCPLYQKTYPMCVY